MLVTKQGGSNDNAETHRQKEPDIEGHCNQHEHVVKRERQARHDTAHQILLQLETGAWENPVEESLAFSVCALR